jgi:hypothetical protein
MFGWLKPKLAPDGPVEFYYEVVIEKSAVDVYAHIDWADPRNCKRELGDEVTSVEGARNRFRLIMDGLPEHLFRITVIEENPHASYAFTCEVCPMIGRLVKLQELYRLEPLTEHSCRVTLVAIATFVDAMRTNDFKREVMTMRVACRNALAKLKIHAEAGVEAVRAMDTSSSSG